MKTRMILLMAAIAACGFAILFAQQRPAGPYTAEQAAAGRAAYQTNCAVCHAADMVGSNEAAQLAGSNFFNQWGERTAGELINFIRSTMPPGARADPCRIRPTSILRHSFSTPMARVPAAMHSRRLRP